MDFVKKQAFFLGCGVAALAGVGLLLWGMSKMSVVQTEMQNVAGLDQQLSGMTRGGEGGGPANPRAIEKEKERIERVKSNYDQVMNLFSQTRKFSPLLEGVLPEAPNTPEGRQSRYEFQTRYIVAMNELLKILNAGQPPTREEIDDTRDYLKKKALQASQFGTGDTAPKAGETPPPSGSPGGRTNAGEGQVVMPPINGPESAAAYWKSLEERAKTDAHILKSISKAKSMFCYAQVGPGGSFELHEIYKVSSTTTQPPASGAIWLAQFWYWVQEDLVRALAAVNNQAANELTARSIDPWVGNLPVKDVLSIRISDYLFENSGKSSGTRVQSDILPSNDPADIFTNRASQPLYTAVNVALVLVVEQTQLPRVLEELCNNRFNVITNVSYEALPLDTDFRDKIYGPDPVIKVRIDLQSYLYNADEFVLLMPEAVRQELRIPPQRIEALHAKAGTPPPSASGDAGAPPSDLPPTGEEPPPPSDRDERPPDDQGTPEDGGLPPPDPDRGRDDRG
ncbi:MAG: hypothetical protein HJJLKODD_02154 [Phycisphaerae bacterium]|nr:hypothetical protein [Phycisphaerae bacterium]